MRLFISRSSPLRDSAAGAERRIKGAFTRNEKRLSALPSQKYALLGATLSGNAWKCMEAQRHKNSVVFRAPWAHGPWTWEPPRGGAQAPGAPFRDFARNRREKVCNSAVLGV